MALKITSGAAALTMVIALTSPLSAQDSPKPPANEQAPAGKTLPDVKPSETAPKAAPNAAAPAEKETAQSIKSLIPTQPSGTFLASEMIGMDVNTADKPRVGTVTDLIHTSNGNIQGLVISVGGFLGIGSHDVALAMDNIHFAKIGDKLAVTIPVQAKALESAPAFKSSAQIALDKKVEQQRQSPAPKPGQGGGPGSR